jgi:hypothetical protein
VDEGREEGQSSRGPALPTASGKTLVDLVQEHSNASCKVAKKLGLSATGLKLAFL